MLGPRRLALLLLLSACDPEPVDDGVIEPSLEAKNDELSGVEDGGPLAFGGAASGDFDRDFQFFAYTFAARNGAAATVEVTHSGSSTGLDTTLFLYALDDDVEPVRLVVDDDDGFAALSRIDGFRLFGSGRYAVVVGTKGASGRGRFRVTLSCDNGECEPEAPPDTACPKAMRDGLVQCLHEVSDERDRLQRFDEIVGETCGTESDLQSLQLRLCAQATVPFCASDDVVASCVAFASAAYPAPTERLAEIDEPTMTALLDAARASEVCSDLGEDASCSIVGNAYRYDPTQSIAIEELLAHARTSLESGPGVAADQQREDGPAGGFAQFMQFLATAAEGEALLDALRVDVSTAQMATAFGGFELSGSTCEANVVVLQFAEPGLVLEFGVLTCS